MKRLHKKMMSAALAASMMASVLSGCGDAAPGSAQVSESVQESAAAAATESAQESEPVASGEPVQAEELGSGEVKWSEEKTADGWTRVTNDGGAELGYYEDSGLQLIQVDGYAFKDLNRNGALDTFEDWRVDYETRAAAIVDELTVDQMIAMKMNPMVIGAPAAASGDLRDEVKNVIELGWRSFRAAGGSTPIENTVAYHNAINKYIEELDGIVVPANFIDDPRTGDVTAWPNNLGLAATFDPAIGQAFGELSAKEWRALGISMQVGIQMDLATEPRWKRILGTFGEDPALASDMAQAVVNGYQSSYAEDGTDLGWGADSVNIQMKHFPGDGAAEGGRESHTDDGKYNVFPGGQFFTHMMPFLACLNLPGETKQASSAMTNYSIAIDGSGNPIGGERVGTSFNKYKLQTLLRGELGWDGYIVSDFGVVFEPGMSPGDPINVGRTHGVENLTPAERELLEMEAGVDGFGGEGGAGQIDLDVSMEAYQLGVERHGEEEMQAMVKESAVRMMKTFFNCGIVDNPYVTVEKAKEVVNNAEHQKAAYDATLKSIVMLKNSENLIHDTSAESEKQTVYIPYKYTAESMDWGQVVPASCGPVIDVTLASQYFNVVTDKVADTLTGPEDEEGNPTLAESDIIRASADEISACDFAIVKIESPKNTRPTKATGQEEPYTYIPMSLQYGEYTANSAYVRTQSIAGDLVEKTVKGTYGDEIVTEQENRSYYGQTAEISNAGDLDLVNYVSSVADKVVVIVNAQNPMVFSEFESEVDGILMGFWSSSSNTVDQAYLDIISGKAEPSALLPMQMPANMETVEMQYEDVPRDMQCHVDADGNTYDFAYGLNWSGVISDARTEKYNVPAVSLTALP